MGNPGLPDPRVAPRVSPSLLTFPPTLPLPLLFPRSLVRIVSSRSFPPLPAHAHSPCFHPSARSDPLRRSKRYFRRQIPPQQRETFRTPGCFPLTFLSPPRDRNIHRVPLFALPSSSPRSSKQNSTDLSIRHLPRATLCTTASRIRGGTGTVTWGQSLRTSCASILQLTVDNA